MKKTVLVVGGAGYIGSQTCKILAQEGYIPVVYDNLTKGHAWAVKWGALEQGDKSDRTTLRRVIDKYKPDAIIDFAASIEAGESVKNPKSYYQNNVVKGIAFLDEVFDQTPIPLVFSSTAAVYGEPDEQPISETAEKAPINPYGSTKLAIEGVLDAYCKAYTGSAVALRYFNASGCDPDGEVGEAHDPETHLIPLMLQALNGSNNTFKVFGRDYPTPDGTCIRDYIHVVDLARAHVAAVEYAIANKGFHQFNCGTGKGSSIAEVIEAAERVTGRKLNAADAERRAGDPSELVADSSNLQSTMGWKPTHSDLDTILSTAWNWIQKQNA